MVREAIRWLLSSLVLLFVVTVLTFVLVAMAPGDAAKAVLNARSGGYTPQQYQEMRRLMGLDQSLPVQYWHWLDHLLHGSMGTDLFNGQPVTQALSSRIGPSLSVIVATLVVSGLVGVALGIVSAQRGGVLGRLVDVVSLGGLAIPNFWLALVLVELFAVRLSAFPATGYTAFGTDPSQWLRGLVLPVLTLSAGAVAFIAKQTRDAMAEVLSQEFVTMLRARGLSTRSVVLKHALRNAAIPVVTLLGLLLVSLLGGTVVVEDVFAIPGLGQQAMTASGSHDLPMIEGVAFVFTVVVVVTNLLVDVSYRLLNPKVRAS
ncbi:ABC transporter permease [Streptacidiphilus sp. EB103A]|uniref:ABC transporter permease n=1 Tax=Streptacidiphilus sp. EB103A TaxID=3156275 RepID=UPI003515268E